MDALNLCGHDMKYEECEKLGAFRDVEIENKI